MKSQDIRMGRVQTRIMQYLWEQGESTAREISDFITATEPISHSTVQTLLRKLEKKNAIRHEVRDRVFYFSAIAAQDDLTRSSTREFLERVFHGSALGLVSHILKNEEMSEDELAELHRMVDAHKEERK